MSTHPSRAGRVFTYAALVAWGVVCFFPLYWLAVTSLKGEAEIVHGPLYLPFVDFQPTLEAWRYILFDAAENLRLQLFNSAFVAFASTALTLLTGGMFVYGITRFDFGLPVTIPMAALLFVAAVGFALDERALAGALLGLMTIAVLAAGQRLRRVPAMSKQVLVFVLLATRILPPVVLVLPVYFMAVQTGTIDTVGGLILVYTASNLPIALWLLTPVIGYRITDQEEAAALDGASRLRIFFRILMPMVAKGITATAVLVFFLCWNEYLFAAYLTSGRAMTLPPWIVGQLSMREAQVGGDLVEWSRLSAAITLTLVPMLAIAVLVQRALGNIAARRG